MFVPCYTLHYSAELKPQKNAQNYNEQQSTNIRFYDSLKWYKSNNL